MIQYIKKIKFFIPDFIFKILRSYGTAILTPFLFSINTGHFISSIKNKSVNKYNKPIPWYTYSCINFIEKIDFSNKNILEFGAGQSTLWWEARAKSVLSFESDRSWFEKINSQKNSNTKIEFIESIAEIEINSQNNKKIKDYCPDVIIIDGGVDRYKSLKISSEYIKNSGIIIIDNSEGYYEKEDHYKIYPMLNFLHEKNYKRVDFYGHAPGVLLTHTTSIFFKSETFIFNNQDYPRMSENSEFYKDLLNYKKNV
jgi:hypothetical protein